MKGYCRCPPPTQASFEQLNVVKNKRNVALYDFHLLPHEAEVAKISITKVVAKAVPDGKVGDGPA